MATAAAPVIKWEMENWVALGGGNSGIVGNEDHDYGFHIGARYLPASDYSRRRDPNGSDGPYVDWDYACAGDFSNKNKDSLRKHHRRVLNGLMNGQYPMICEFIGKPWADRPVYYWARWNGVETLQRYTGAGHDHWSHISWYRSRVDERANLWTPEGDDMPTAKEIAKATVTELMNEQIDKVDADSGSEPDMSFRSFVRWTHKHTVDTKLAVLAADPADLAGKLAPVLVSALAGRVGAPTTEQLTEALRTVLREGVEDEA